MFSMISIVSVALQAAIAEPRTLAFQHRIICTDASEDALHRAQATLLRIHTAAWAQLSSQKAPLLVLLAQIHRYRTLQKK
jgi:hypothetical protein